jgi:hypothetical protein
MDEQEIREVLDELEISLGQMGLSWIADQARQEIIRRQLGEDVYDTTGVLEKEMEFVQPAPRIVSEYERLNVLVSTLRKIAEDAQRVELAVVDFLEPVRVEFTSETSERQTLVVSRETTSNRLASVNSLSELLEQLLERARA